MRSSRSRSGRPSRRRWRHCVERSTPPAPGRADLDAVLMVGGSSRIPLITQLVSAELGRPVAVDADPKSVIATGAAIAARGLRRHARSRRDPPQRGGARPGREQRGSRCRSPRAAAPVPQPSMTLTKPAAPARRRPDGSRCAGDTFTAAGSRLAGIGPPRWRGARPGRLHRGGDDALVLSGADAARTTAGGRLLASATGRPQIGAAPCRWSTNGPGEAPAETTVAGPRRPVVLAAKVRPRGRIGPVAAPVPTAAPVPPPATDVTTPARTSRSTPPAPTPQPLGPRRHPPGCPPRPPARPVPRAPPRAPRPNRQRANRQPSRTDNERTEPEPVPLSEVSPTGGPGRTDARFPAAPDHGPGAPPGRAAAPPQRTIVFTAHRTRGMVEPVTSATVRPGRRARVAAPPGRRGSPPSPPSRSPRSACATRAGASTRTDRVLWWAVETWIPEKEQRLLARPDPGEPADGHRARRPARRVRAGSPAGAGSPCSPCSGPGSPASRPPRCSSRSSTAPWAGSWPIRAGTPPRSPPWPSWPRCCWSACSGRR